MRNEFFERQMAVLVGDTPYWVVDGADDNDYPAYAMQLMGPDGWECVLGEPEDKSWLRDGLPVVEKLNEQAAEIAALRELLAEAGAG